MFLFFILLNIIITPKENGVLQFFVKVLELEKNTKKIFNV